MSTVPVDILVAVLIAAVVSLVFLLLAGARHGYEQYQRGYVAGQAAERARGER